MLKIHREKQAANRALVGDDYRTDLDLVFRDVAGNYFKPDSITAKACLAARKAGFQNVGIHTLRHSHGSQLLSKREAPGCVEAAWPQLCGDYGQDLRSRAAERRSQSRRNLGCLDALGDGAKAHRDYLSRMDGCIWLHAARSTRVKCLKRNVRAW